MRGHLYPARRNSTRVLAATLQQFGVWLIVFVFALGSFVGVILGIVAATPLKAAAFSVTENFTSTARRDSATTAAWITTPGYAEATHTTDNWIQVTGGGLAGIEVSAIAVSPNFATDATVVVAARGGGLWKSTNGGSSWSAINSGVSNLIIDDVAFSPAYATDSTIFAIYSATSSSGGVFKTTNGGTSWSTANSGLSSITEFRTLRVSPAYATDSTVFVTTNSGVYKTTNGGTSWSAANTGITGSNTFAFTFTPNYATSSTVFVSENSGTDIYKSTDGGANWSVASTAASAVYALAASPNYATDATLFLAGSSEMGMMKSTDGGTNWSVVNTGISFTYMRDVVFSPNYASDSTVFAVSQGSAIWKTTNGGTSWSQVVSSISDDNMDTYPIYHAVAIAPDYATSATLFFGTAGSLWKTTNGASSWSKVSSSFSLLDVRQIAFAPNFTTSKTVFAASSDGPLKSTDMGMTWTKNYGINNNAFSLSSIAVSPGYATDTTIFLASRRAGVWKSTDGGTTWASQNTGYPNDETANNVVVTSITLSPNYATDSTLVTVIKDGGVYKSTSGGSSPTTINTGIPSLTARKVVFSPSYSTDSTLYVATDAGVGKSTDGGSNWSTINSGLAVTNVNSLAIVSTSTIFAAMGNNGGIYKSTNAGSTWTAVNTGLTDLTIGNIAASPDYATDSTLFAVASGGGSAIYRSTDGGATWSALTTGIAYGPNFNAGAEPRVSFSPNYTNDGIVFVGLPGQSLARIFRYSSSSLVQSLSIHTQAVSSVQLDATDSLNGGTIAYQVTEDGGRTWIGVTSGQETQLTGSGTDHRWRSTITAASTLASPQITKVVLSYTPPVTPPSVPVAPTIGTPQILSTSTIRWAFTDHAGNESGFRMHDAAHAVVVDSGITDAPNLSYLDEINLTPNTEYRGRHAHAFNSVGESPASADAVAAVTLQNPPTGLVVTASSLNSVTVEAQGSLPNLTVGSSGVAIVNPDRSLQSGWIQTTSFTFTGLMPDTPYQFLAAARNQAGIETSATDAVFVRTPPAPPAAVGGGPAAPGSEPTPEAAPESAPEPAPPPPPPAKTKKATEPKPSAPGVPLGEVEPPPSSPPPETPTPRGSAPAPSPSSGESATSPGSVGGGSRVVAPVAGEAEPPGSVGGGPSVAAPGASGLVAVAPAPAPAPGEPAYSPPETIQEALFNFTSFEIPETVPTALPDPVQKTIARIIPGADATIQETLDNPKIESVTKDIVIPAVATVAVVNTAMAAASAIPFTLPNALPMIQLLFTQPVLLWRRRGAKQWGVVYNSLTKAPVDLALVRLLDAETSRVVRTTVTDRLGRFAFVVDQGTYRITVNKPGFDFPTTYLARDTSDAAMTTLYHGEAITTTTHTELTPSIPLDPPEVGDLPLQTLIRHRLYRRSREILGGASIGFAGISFIIVPTPLFAVVFLLQIVLFVLFHRLSHIVHPAHWGLVYDLETKTPIPNAIVRLFDSRFHRLIEAEVTSAAGRYTMLAGPNLYMLTVEREGYAKYEKSTLDLRGEKEPVVAEQVGLRKIKNKKSKIKDGMV